MADKLTNTDLRAIEGIIDRALDEKLQPVVGRLDAVEQRLDGLTDMVSQGFAALGVKVTKIERVAGATFRN